MDAASVASDGLIGDEVADHVTGAVLEARIRPVRVDGPSKDVLIEGGGLSRILGRDAQVGDPSMPEDG